MDILSINALAVKSRIGIHAWEQAIEQTLLIDVSIPLDCRACTESIESTVDYFHLCEIITQHLTTHSFALIEQVANSTAELLKTTFNLEKISLTVHKPKAIPSASDVSICIQR